MKSDYIKNTYADSAVSLAAVQHRTKTANAGRNSDVLPVAALRDFAVATQACFLEFGADMTVQRAHGDLRTLLGISPGQVHGATLRELNPSWAGTGSGWHHLSAGASPGNPVREFGCGWQRPDGSHSRLRVNARALFTEQGKFAGCRVALRTAQAAPVAFGGSEQRMTREALDVLPARIAVLDGRGVIVSVNAAWREAANANKLAMAEYGVGANYLAVCDTALGEESDDALAAARGVRDLLSGEREEFRFEYACTGAPAPTWYRLSASSYLRETEDDRTRIILAHESISELKIQQREIADLRRSVQRSVRLNALGERASSLVHELYQPLTAASDFCHTVMHKVRDRLPADDEVAQLVHEVCGQLGRAGDIVRRLRSQDADSAITPGTCDLADVVGRAMALGQEQRSKNGVSLAVLSQNHLPWVQIGSGALARVLRNLERNAIDAMEAAQTTAPAIEIELKPLGDSMVELVMRDNGPGLSESLCEEAFEPFFTTKRNGMGMGLAICRSTIEAQGGRLWAVPAHSGEFHLQLPAVPPVDSKPVGQSTL